MTDKEIGFRTCVSTLGEEFWEKNKENAVFGCGDSEKGLYCFLGISTKTNQEYDLQLSNHLEDWEYYVICYVNDGSAKVDQCRVPELV